MRLRNQFLKYASTPFLTHYDGEGEGEGGGDEDGEGSGGGNEPRLFTQDEVNEFLAKDRRKHQAALEKTEQAYKKALENKELDAAERQKLEESLNVVQGELRTYKQQFESEKRQLQDQHSAEVTDLKGKAAHWEQMYHTSTIQRDLLDAAVANDAYDPEQVVQLLDRNTKLVEIVSEKGKPTGKYKTVVTFADTDADGNPTSTTRSPAEAVKRMRELPRFRNLFKSNVVPGMGGSSNAGGAPTNTSGQVDYKKLAENPELFRKLRKENPAAIYGN